MRRHMIFRGAAVCASLVLATRPAAAQQASQPAPTDVGYRAPASVRGSGPDGATLRCRDGSYPAPMAPESACDGKGGVRARYPLLKTPAAPGAPAPRSRPAPAPAEAAPTVEPTPSRANVIVPAVRPPEDATLMCTDGTFIRADTSAARCAANGGVKLRFPPRRPR